MNETLDVVQKLKDNNDINENQYLTLMNSLKIDYNYIKRMQFEIKDLKEQINSITSEKTFQQLDVKEHY
tara:strand:+ start:651 stop:857 length:207 start_codon:yes stop_codon:yes gene_type:complete